MKILGVDPGSRVTGFGRGNSSCQLIASIGINSITITQMPSSGGFASIVNTL